MSTYTLSVLYINVSDATIDISTTDLDKPPVVQVFRMLPSISDIQTNEDRDNVEYRNSMAARSADKIQEGFQDVGKFYFTLNSLAVGSEVYRSDTILETTSDNMVLTEATLVGKLKLVIVGLSRKQHWEITKIPKISP